MEKTQYLHCRVIRDDGIHAGIMLKDGNVHACPISAGRCTRLPHVSVTGIQTSRQRRPKRPESADLIIYVRISFFFFATDYSAKASTNK